MDREEIIKNIKETNETIGQFLGQCHQGQQIDHAILAQIIKEFSEALLYLLEQE